MKRKILTTMLLLSQYISILVCKENITVDELLEDARTISEKDERLKKFEKFEEEIDNDIPAIFLYSPDFIYIKS